MPKNIKVGDTVSSVNLFIVKRIITSQSEEGTTVQYECERKKTKVINIFEESEIEEIKNIGE